MLRFKNRYLLVELAFKDGKIDETISECTIDTKIRTYSLSWLPLIAQCPSNARHTSLSPFPTSLPFSISQLAAEQIILGDIRQSLQQNFGDHALGSALVSLFGKYLDRIIQKGDHHPSSSSSSSFFFFSPNIPSHLHNNTIMQSNTTIQ